MKISKLQCFVGIFLLAVVGVLVWFVSDESRLTDFIKKYFGDDILAGFKLGLNLGLGIAFIVGLLGFFMAKPKKKDTNQSVGKISTSLIVACAMVYLPFASIAAENMQVQLPVERYVSFPAEDLDGYVLVAESRDLIPIESVAKDSVLWDAVRISKETGQTNVTINIAPVVLWCLIKVTVVVLVIAGIVYVAYKIYKACQRLINKKNKQLEEDEEIPPPPITNYAILGKTTSGPIRNFVPEGVEVFCASFIFAAGQPTAEDDNSCDCLPPVSLRYSASEGTGVQVSSYVPRNLEDETTYFLRRGLSTNETVVGNQVTASYSYNWQPTNYLSEITFVDGMVSVNLPGRTNTTHAIWTASSLTNTSNGVNWTNMLRISVPVGSQMKAGFNPINNEQYFQLVK